MSRAWSIIAALLLAGGLSWSAARVLHHERSELAFTSRGKTLSAAAREPGSTRVTGRLATLELRAGDYAIFEVCTDDGFAAARWRGAPGFAVFQLDPLKLLLRVPIDDAHLAVIKRDEQRACLALGGGTIERDAKVAVDVLLPEPEARSALAKTSLWVRVLAHTPLDTVDRIPILLIALGAVVLVIGLFVTRRSASPPAAPLTSRHGLALLLGFALVVLGWLASAYVGPFGPTASLAKTIALAGVEVFGALWLVRLGWPEPRAADLLSLHAPLRAPGLSLLAALAFGLLLMVNAILCVRLIPSTSESAIETFVSWPSGMLSFATIGVLVPVCEEIFFRGFVYARALAYGKGAAFAISAGSFIALHAAQTWGNWGSLASITAAGLVLTALRARTGSTLIPALAHIVYNLGLTLRSF